MIAAKKKMAPAISERLMKKRTLSKRNDGIKIGTKRMSIYVISGILAHI